MNGNLRPIRDNLVALVSLLVAFSALGYNTWRNERTEHNRNVRVVGIEMLREIGALQRVITYRHFAEEEARGDPHSGWPEVYMIGDLAAVMPPSVARDAKSLRAVWEASAGDLVESDEAFAKVDGALDALRQSTLAELRALR
jgi:hypothetical protein